MRAIYSPILLISITRGCNCTIFKVDESSCKFMCSELPFAPNSREMCYLRPGENPNANMDCISRQQIIIIIQSHQQLLRKIWPSCGLALIL